MPPCCCCGRAELRQEDALETTKGTSDVSMRDRIHTPNTPLHKTVHLTAWVSFFTDFSSEMIYPLLPLFLGNLGAGKAFIGLVEGVAEATASLLKFVSGKVSDRLQRRKGLVVLGYSVSSVARPLVGLAMLPWHVLILRVLDRTGKGLRSSPRDALIADVTPADQRGRAYGYQRAMDHSGAVVGPLVATLLMTGFLVRERTVFLLAAIPAAVAVGLVLLIRETPRASDVKADRNASPSSPSSRLDLRLMRVIGVLILFALSNSSDAFLLLRAGDLGVSVALIPALWSMHHLVKASLSTPCGALSDRLGRVRTIAVGWFVYVLVYAGFALASQPVHIWVLFGAYGLFFALTEGTEKALIADLCESHQRGLAFGVYNAGIGVAALVSSLTTGLLWQAFGATTALLTGSGIAVLALALMLYQQARARPRG